MFGVVITSTPEERASWLVEAMAIMDENFPRTADPREVLEKRTANQ